MVSSFSNERLEPWCSSPVNFKNVNTSSAPCLVETRDNKKESILLYDAEVASW